VVRQFTGLIHQVPPMYSALKKDWRALYYYARAGIEVERDAREVRIFALTATLTSDSQGRAALKMTVKCSKGTYVRTLAEDMGEALGCGAHLIALRRIETGRFGLSQCVTLQALEGMPEDERVKCLWPTDTLLCEHTPIELDAENSARFLSGLRRRGDWPDTAQVAVYARNPRTLLGSAHVRAGELIPGRLLSPIEIEQMTRVSQTGLKRK
jgi:tRNA pseudouridine55 synthase